MAVIFQRNRILVDEIWEDKKSEFVKKNTVFDKNMSFGYTEKWVGFTEVLYNGKPYIALPRNYPLAYLKPYLIEHEFIRDDYYFPYKLIEDIKCEASPRDELQVKLLDFLIGRNEYIDLKNKPRRGLFADTGVGKTFLTLKYICGFKIMACIFCPDDRAIKTWKDEIAKFTNIQEKEIAIVQGRSSLKGILKKKDTYKIMLFSNKTFSSMVDSNDEEVLIDFFKEMEVGLKVHDEMHLHLRVVFFSDMILQIARTIYLTATDVMRIYGEQKIMNNLKPSEDCIYKQEVVEKFNFVKILYHSNPTDKAHSKGIEKPNGFDALSYLKYIMSENLPYRDFFFEKVIRPTIKLAIKKSNDPDNFKIAILTKTKAAGLEIASFLHENYPDKTIGIFTSDIPDMKIREKELEKNFIISTDKSFSGILNIYNLSVIINSTPVTSEAHITQIMGRLRKEKDKPRVFIQLCDYSFKKAKNMMYRQSKICEPISVSISEIKVNPPLKMEIEEDDC